MPRSNRMNPCIVGREKQEKKQVTFHGYIEDYAALESNESLHCRARKQKRKRTRGGIKQKTKKKKQCGKKEKKNDEKKGCMDVSYTKKKVSQRKTG